MLMKTILRVSALCVLFAGSALALTGERFAEIPLDKMTPEQRTVAEAIMSGPRKGMSGPFNAWLRSPILADRLQKVGEYVRFNSSLDRRINEMAIIMTAQFWGSQYEWYAHAPLAIKAGLDRQRRVGVPLILRAPVLRGHDDRHLVDAPVQRAVEADIFADLLQPVRQDRAAQPGVERAA